MDIQKEIFNPKFYVAKFSYQKYCPAVCSDLRQRVSGDLYLRKLKIELLDKKGNLSHVFEYSLEDNMNTLLPLLHWDDFEKTRDAFGWDLPGNAGYRDGWGYEFICMNESGNPMIKNKLDVVFDDKKKPAYEKLLDWIVEKYAGEKELKKKRLVW